MYIYPGYRIDEEARLCTIVVNRWTPRSLALLCETSYEYNNRILTADQKTVHLQGERVKGDRTNSFRSSSGDPPISFVSVTRPEPATHLLYHLGSVVLHSPPLSL
ncbi:hypothetical protein ANTQUA_LOCUS7397 [Anthophora quadrimaculata]